MADSKRDEFLYDTFPPGFVWATATASYQIEGAWNKDGKGENIWDRFCHDGGHVYNEDNGDVACDSYHKYDEDIQLMKNLGTSHYRFSISWARLMPKGTKEVINEAGIAFYDRFISALKKAGIEPMVTLYHWDLPQALQDIGGWQNEALVEHFNDYARLCYQRFGDRVKMWITFNEPYVFAYEGYGAGEHAPGHTEPGDKPYIASRIILKAHAKAYHTYSDEFRDSQNGKVGITNNTDWREPKDATNQSDVTAAERSMQFFLGWFANAVYGDGGYPLEMREAVDRKSRQAGLAQSRLPEFTQEEKVYIKGSADFFGLNYYTTRYVEHEDLGYEDQSYATDSDLNVTKDPEWKRGQSVWLYSAPWGLRKLLNWIRTHYNNPPLYITENGWSDSGTMEDTDRIDYYRKHINETLKAVKLDGCDVRGYTAWSLIDNFEWAMGYSEKFGLHQVDFNDPNRPRKAKSSAAFYTQVVRDNGFPEGKPKL